jgi:hypothetical protein
MPAAADVELDRKVAILHRFRELLIQQREKFRKYLVVLDREREDIEEGDVDTLAAHVEMEEQIVSEIYTFQKAIDPLEEIYRAAYPAARDDPELPAIKGSLDELREEVLKRNAENRALLKRRMEMVRAEIAGFRSPLKARSSVYAGQDGGALVDIEG